jgi:hypothetical protein
MNSTFKSNTTATLSSKGTRDHEYSNAESYVSNTNESSTIYKTVNNGVYAVNGAVKVISTPNSREQEKIARLNSELRQIYG